MVRSTVKSTYFKELLLPFFKIFYTLIVHYVINFVFSIGKQPYRDVIDFVSYIHVVYSYNDINFTYLHMRTNYLRHLANIVDILWSRPVWGGGGGAQLPIELVNLLQTPKSVTLQLQTNMMQYSRWSMDKLYYSKFNFFVKINQTISNFYIYHKYMTYHIYCSIFWKKLHLYFYLFFTRNVVSWTAFFIQCICRRWP